MPSGRRGTLILLAAGVLGPIVLWILATVAGALTSGYDPVRESISSLVSAPLGWLQTLSFVLQGGLGVAWAFGASRAIGTTARQRRVVLCLFAAQAAIAFGFALLPTDREGAATSLVGQLHLVDFYLFAIAFPVISLTAWRVFRSDPRWQSAARPTLLAAALALVAIALVPLTVDGPLTPWLGLLERAYIAVPSAWQLGVAVHAIRLTARLAPDHRRTDA